MTARRLALAAVTLPAAAGALIGWSFAVTFRRTGHTVPAIVLWLDENYPETETP